MNRTVNGDPNGVLIIEDSLYVHVARRPAARRMHAKAPPPPPIWFFVQGHYSCTEGQDPSERKLNKPMKPIIGICEWQYAIIIRVYYKEIKF